MPNTSIISLPFITAGAVRSASSRRIWSSRWRTLAKVSSIRRTLTAFFDVRSASASIMRSFRSSGSPASAIMRRTAESVTPSSPICCGRMCSPTSFATYFILTFMGSFILRKMRSTIFSPMKLWLRNVQPVCGEYCLVTGFAMSCISAAQRSHSKSETAATLSTTCSVCAKLSLCPRPSMVSTPLRATSSGKMSSSSPDMSSNLKPIEGLGLRSILESSVLMRSLVIMDMRSRLRHIASKVSRSMRKLSCVAKRIARIMRSGSSEKVTSGSQGVRSSLLWRSMRPL